MPAALLARPDLAHSCRLVRRNEFGRLFGTSVVATG